MAEKQLEMVANWEREKEQRYARDFQLAQQHAQMNKQKLTSLEQYRLDYLRQSQLKAKNGVVGQNFNQLQTFVGKLDKACQQQMQVHSQSLLVAEQRRNLWLKQQSKRKAVEMLLEKKQQQRLTKENKQEQAFLDELSTQRYIRRTASP